MENHFSEFVMEFVVMYKLRFIKVHFLSILLLLLMKDPFDKLDFWDS